MLKLVVEGTLFPHSTFEMWLFVTKPSFSTDCYWVMPSFALIFSAFYQESSPALSRFFAVSTISRRGLGPLPTILLFDLVSFDYYLWWSLDDFGLSGLGWLWWFYWTTLPWLLARFPQIPIAFFFQYLSTRFTEFTWLLELRRRSLV